MQCFAYTFLQKRDTAMRMALLCSGGNDVSFYMHADILNLALMSRDLSSADVKIWTWPSEVKRRMFRCVSMRETRWLSNYCYSVLRSKIIYENLYGCFSFLTWPQSTTVGIRSLKFYRWRLCPVTSNALVFFCKDLAQLGAEWMGVQPTPSPCTADAGNSCTRARVKFDDHL